MKVLLAALVVLPMTANATLIEWVGIGEQTYYWEDQAHPTATISILADQDSIHRINISNTKTSLTFDDVDLEFIWGTGVWSQGLALRGHLPDFYASDPSNTTLLDTMLGWTIREPGTANPFNHLDQMNFVQVGSDAREFSFTPTEWTKTVVSENSQPSEVPEPSTLALLGLGLAGLGWKRRLNMRQVPLHS